ncbi:hypothetical protein E0Z10_g3548 [Xylaria hypoxylon]|uniref:protein-ribulosamine 3-kinase n=1 Tax=Xylaria hypoxylon TaxID=37992 RepID=A0A4Z0Z0G3_9PEZI|nr:hypothetical protein E0Z10_g3548 [Xylaria hypoxylon]
MPSKVDPAIIEALSLDPNTTKITSHGGSGFASTFKLSSTVNGKEMNYFVKTGTGEDAALMFQGTYLLTYMIGEHESLNAISKIVPSLCPRSYAHGAFKDSHDNHFMATDFLDLNSSTPGGSGETLAQKLARLHTTPAPNPEGYDKPMYGFPVATCCGSSLQKNSWKASWADFYANNRLRAIIDNGVRNNGADAELSKAVEKTADVIVPRLLGDDHLKGVQPVVVHGDLWSGNHGRGRIAGKGGVEEVVFDPSCVYGHSEYELGIMKMFGGFGSNFWKEYESLVPKSEPKEEWEDRVALYELYHHLNHWALFVVGISGASSSGKTTLARLLRDVFPHTFILHEDDFYRPENELPSKHGLLDWDCAESINFEDMARALEHIIAEGTFPPFVDSLEDQNTVGKCTVPESAISAAKSRVEAWMAPGQPGHAIFSSSSPNLRLCILDGFLLFGPDPPLRRITDELLDIKFFLTVSRQKATARREGRDGYVTLEGFWTDPPGYVEKIVWPNYMESHAWLFEDGDVEKRLKGEILREKDILVFPEVLGRGGKSSGEENGKGLDIAMHVMFEWAVDTIMQKLEEIMKKR